VATMGNPAGLDTLLQENEGWLIGDWCEAHGALLLDDEYADHYCDASIYSFYAAHLVVGGEGGAICTNNDELAALCRSIKSHGRPASGYFNFERIGYNSKWNEPAAAIALGSLERFDEMFEQRREVRAKLLRAFKPFEDKLLLYRDEPGQVISPHAFPIVSRGELFSTIGNVSRLYRMLEGNGVQCKTLFGSLPTQHDAFGFLGHTLGDFPVAEQVGRAGLHIGCHELITDDDIALIAKTVGEFLK
jgi:dTDP-4-amino-4,6-dideoxygalactose transaminase